MRGVRAGAHGVDILIWIGSAVALGGVAALLACALAAARARGAGLAEAELRARLQRLVALNLAALLVATAGLMLVVVGLILG